jgi:hypothetical protein
VPSSNASTTPKRIIDGKATKQEDGKANQKAK